MPLTASPLPADWMKVLDEVQMRLDQAIASASARMDQAASIEPGNFAEAHNEAIARWQQRLQRLSAYLESAEQIVQSVDEVLDGEEKRLRGHLAIGERLRQKLADGAAGAIGYTL